MQLRVRSSLSLRGTATAPGDKSISHRALLLGAIAQDTSEVYGWLPAADCQATLRAVRAMGVPVEHRAPDSLIIYGRGLRGLRPPGSQTVLDCQGSGTTMRLLAGILAGYPATSVLDGHAGLRRRPMERVAIPLRLMGAQVETTNGCPPITIRGGTLRAIEYTMPVASAQVKSAILLAGLYAEGETVVHQPGPARDHTERMLRAQGVSVLQSNNTVRLSPSERPLAPLRLTVPADFSSAAFMLVAALLVPDSEVLLHHTNVNPTRTGLLDALQAMGAHIQVGEMKEQGGEPVAELLVRSTPLQAGQVAGELVVRMIDEFPIFAVAATQASGSTIVRDAQELRVKESDRIAAVATELRKMGAHIEEWPDGFIVEGPVTLQGAHVDSHGDHRLAMALVVAGLIARGETVVHGCEVIGDSFPGFVPIMRQLGANIEEV
ncbi:MAG: 3-phosphoshikimate 1-carboxyvinyltransferase [Anaerolineae bacterium]